jgi:hypothetical protein
MDNQNQEENKIINKEEDIFHIQTDYWYNERMVYLLGGVFVAGSALLSLFVQEKFIYFTIFVGIMFINFSLTGYCPMAIILDKLGVKRK